MRHWKLWAGTSVLLSAGVVAAIIWTMSGNSAQVIKTGSLPQTVKVPAYKTYNGRYISLTYKGIYQQKSHTVQPGVEQTLLRANTSYEKTLAIEVQPFPQGGMTADSGYQYRQMHHELYQASQITVDGAPATDWVKIDGTEQTVYLQHQTSYAVISFSLAGTNDITGLPDEVTTLLQSVHWK